MKTKVLVTGTGEDERTRPLRAETSVQSAERSWTDGRSSFVQARLRLVCEAN